MIISGWYEFSRMISSCSLLPKGAHKVQLLSTKSFIKAYLLNGKNWNQPTSWVPFLSHTWQEHRACLASLLPPIIPFSICLLLMLFLILSLEKSLEHEFNFEKCVSRLFPYFQTNHVSVLKSSISPTIKIPAWTAGRHRLQSTCTYSLTCFSWVRRQPTNQFQCLRNCHFVCFIQTIFSKNSNINLLQPTSPGYHKKLSNCFFFSFFFFSWL